ncbi:MAG: YbaN family protein [Melioribacteraceae bacterium]|nr:MAG: YbaN family protein [Melioribacteraceae bacterium]
MSDKIQIHSNRLVRWLLITAGWFFVTLGVIGLFLPVMPTTIFLIIAAACFARSSDKFYNWLLNNKQFGKLIRDYREHRGMPLRAKFIAIIMLNLFIGYSAIFAVELVWVKILLLVIAIGVTTYIISIKTLRPNQIQEEFQES